MSHSPTQPSGDPIRVFADERGWSPSHSAGPADRHRGDSRRGMGGPLAWLAGMVVLLAGTFLPWLYSGSVAKNSYQLAGVGQRRLALPAWVDVLLGGWPFLGPLWAILTVLYLVNLRRTAAALAVVLAAIVGLLAGAVVARTAGLASPYLSAALAGPIMTTVGAILILVGAGAELIRRK